MQYAGASENILIVRLLKGQIFSANDWSTEEYTEVQRSQHLTQRDMRVYGQSYVANTSSVDGRSAFLQEKAQHDHVDYFQSFAKYHEPGLIIKLPAEVEAAIRRDQQIIDLENNATRLRNANASPCEISNAKKQVGYLYRKLAKKRLAQCQAEWVQNRRDWKVNTRGKDRPEDSERRDLSEILYVLMPELRRLASTMLSTVVVSHEERKQAVQDLCTLVSRDCRTLFRPGERPIDNLCPVKNCMKDVSKYVLLDFF